MLEIFSPMATGCSQYARSLETQVGRRLGGFGGLRESLEYAELLKLLKYSILHAAQVFIGNKLTLLMNRFIGHESIQP